jgi:Domain of unknown function (DUF4143)
VGRLSDSPHRCASDGLTSGTHRRNPPWIPSHNHMDRLGQSAKHHLADPALAARLLGLDDAALLRAEQGSTDLSEGTILGALFEHLAALSIHTYAEAAEVRVGHLRTRNNDFCCEERANELHLSASEGEDLTKPPVDISLDALQNSSSGLRAVSRC